MKTSALAVLGLLSLASAQAALADTPAPSPSAPSAALSAPPTPADEQAVQAQLKTFDPEAVKAAEHYYNSPTIKNGMLSMITSLTPSIIANMTQHEAKQLSDDDRAKVVKILDDAMRQNFDYLIGLNTVVALRTFSKEELVAMDTFYSSAMGQRILSKMPQLSKSMPSVMHSFLPKYLASVKEDMKAEGVGAK